MKVKTINRSETQFTKERSEDVTKVHRNLDPNLHPFERAVEYTRALNAAKLDRVFAKPFIAALQHSDGVYCLAKNPKRLNSLLAGCGDGDISLWDIPVRRCLRKLIGHTARVGGVSVGRDGETCVSCSSDCTVKLWKVPYAPLEKGPVVEELHPVMEFEGKSGFRGIDHHWGDDRFATCGAQVDLWDHERSEPITSFTWGADSVLSVRFNPAEANTLASTGSDRGITLYDLRDNSPLHKLVMQTRSNQVAWNPQEPMNFTVANEDCCLYTYDMRKMHSARMVHKDFVSAVMSVDYSPTGREFVAGSYDRSVRIFPYNGGHSREVYTAKRMQRVFTTLYSGDGKYVFSGSDDMNLRVWKSAASEQLGSLLPRERHKQAYQKALVERFKHLPEVKRIVRHRHLPRAIYGAAKLQRTVVDSDKKRERNRIAHSAPGTVKVKAARKKKVVALVD